MRSLVTQAVIFFIFIIIGLTTLPFYCLWSLSQQWFTYLTGRKPLQ